MTSPSEHFELHVQALRSLYLQMVPMKIFASLLLDPKITISDSPAVATQTLSDYQRWLLTPLGQQQLGAKLFLHPDCRSYPPELSYSTAIMKKLHSFLEGHVTQLASERPVGEEDDDLCIDEELLDFYMECIQGGPNRSIKHASTVAGGDNNNKGMEDVRSVTSAMFYKSFCIPKWTGPHEEKMAPAGGSESFLVPIKVTQDFVNVGLAVWPAGLVIVELLRLGFFGLAQRDTTQQNLLFEGLEDTSLRIVELGAGVGFTAAAFLEWFEPGVQEQLPPVDYCYMTDYQDVIVENCKANIKGMVDLVDENTSRRQDQAKLPVLDAPILDWCEHETNDDLLARWKPNVLIAADVVYDQSVIPDLATTLEQGLRNGGSQARAIVVSTKRNEVTFGLFLTELQKRRFQIHSYPLPEVRNSFCQPGASDPLSTWANRDHLNIQKLFQCNETSDPKAAHDCLGSDLSPLGSFPFFVAMQDLVIVHIIRLEV